nr:MAG TPA: hypothetical protein [Caudoviricetes sp.]
MCLLTQPSSVINSETENKAIIIYILYFVGKLRNFKIIYI